ncbi:unnamed protein product [Mytilus coruscus]|uniref:G domain-containing protein n=1 Tax=Mytilus coruscus TaxID=42192 RepID=A0A6J8A7B5_MYTCO|nr:unnamed protein product [Mytilus coruscus]
MAISQTSLNVRRLGKVHKEMKKRDQLIIPSQRKIFECYKRTVRQENILLIGTIGAGKSATINTITATLSGEKSYKAPTGSKGTHMHKDGRRRTTTHLIWYNKCGIDGAKQKDMTVPKAFPHLVDMTGLADTCTKDQQELLEMIITGRIPDQTSIPALQDIQNAQGSWWQMKRDFPFSMNSRKIHKILFVACADEPIPKHLIQSVKNVAQPDGSRRNMNPRYIPIFGILTKTDLVDWKDAKILEREDEFLEFLGIDSASCYARWKNDVDGEYTSSHLLFLSKLLSPDVRIVLDQRSVCGYLLDSFIEHPILFISVTVLVVAIGYCYFSSLSLTFGN